MIPHRFGRAAPWTLGIEEEVVLVDAEALEATPGFSRILGEPTEELKPELFECFVELATPVVSDADAALAELVRLRRELTDRAAPFGIGIHAAGTHALARWQEQTLVPFERYRKLEAKLGDRIRRQLVCGLHVHVSVPDAQTCLRAFETIVPWLPVLLALSANSPFSEGQDTGLRSVRAERLLEMPTGGTPPVVGTWDDWAAATRGDHTRRHWDAWPRPEYGTLEVRVMDMQTDVRRSAGFAAVAQALVAGADGATGEPYDRDLYDRRRRQAALEPPEPDEVASLAALVEPVARRLGAWHLAESVLGGRPEAELQLAVAADRGVEAVPRDVVARTLAF
ncbi:MAG TPA: YbdK family carboxylate-amine ligase [Gaiellaceae bacterium]|nr:YbdK family carboxylate-amine ligase [Gaiellaceae bacterium]